MRHGWANLKKIEDCNCGFQKPVSLSSFLLFVTFVINNAFETLFAVILSFTSNFSSSIANAYKTVAISNILN